MLRENIHIETILFLKIRDDDYKLQLKRCQESK